jgi:hypothetical protein
MVWPKDGATERAVKAARARNFFILQRVLLLGFVPTRSIQRRDVNKRKREHGKVIHISVKRFAYFVQTISAKD